MSLAPDSCGALQGWAGHLDLHYAHDVRYGTRLRHRHDGPMRVFKSLYPHGPDCCHTVLIHPPGGLVGGDSLSLRIALEAGAHALLSTPGATRFYASDEACALQRVHIDMAAGSRLEWCPLEAIAYPSCKAINQWQARLAPGAELMAWDLLALGLPAAGLAFDCGHYQQEVSITGHWLERLRIDAGDAELMSGPLGLAGRRAMASFWFASGDPLPSARQQQLVEAARALLPPPTPQGRVRLAATSPNRHVVVVRGLADQVEPLMQALQSVWAVWRAEAWGLSSPPPRIWQV